MKNIHRLLVLGICLLFLSCSSDDNNNPDIDFLGYTWNRLNTGVFSYSENGAVLELELKQNAAWFNGEQGGMFYTLITGDFDFMATVRTTKRSDTAAPPDADFSFGGLIIRDPNTSQENYVHLVTGTGDTSEGSPYGYEYKSTFNDNSDFNILYDGDWEHDLRIVRSGNTFTFYRRAAGSGDEVIWNEITSFPFTLSSQVQVGFNVYTNTDSGALVDLKTTFSNIRIIETE